METDPVDAAVAAAEDGLSLDGLAVRREEASDGGRFHLSVGDEEASDIDEGELRSRLEAAQRYVRNWFFWTEQVPPGEDRRAFLRWLEDADDVPVPERYERLADGVHAEWGQLLVTVGLDEAGRRTYALRHVDDADVDPESLTAHEDPLDARAIATYDDRERYRPLKTAPTLQRGWRFPELDADGLVRAVECFYPATIPNWHREREGELDVDHWSATAERQTGIYDVIEDLPREAVEWVAESCCVDSQCLKRREWDYDADDELDVERGDGAFPCREPCSLVVAAARKWTILEGETERTYEFELTPSEKHQLEGLIDAVADGRVDEIREADVGDPANRYRARYLRAKRFDEEGSMGREVERADPDASGDDGETTTGVETGAGADAESAADSTGLVARLRRTLAGDPRGDRDGQ